MSRPIQRTGDATFRRDVASEKKRPNNNTTTTTTTTRPKTQTTERPVNADPHGVWYDIEADRLRTDGETVGVAGFEPEFKHEFVRTMGRFNTISRARCRGFFIRHESNASWCGHPLCPSCWIRNQIKARGIVVNCTTAGGWIIRYSDCVGLTEIVDLPQQFKNLWSGRNNPNLQLAAHWIEVLPSDDWEVGWCARRVGIFATRSTQAPRLYRADVAADPRYGVEIPTYYSDGEPFAAIWQKWVSDSEDALYTLREISRSPYSSVHHPMLGIICALIREGHINLGRTFRSNSKIFPMALG